MGGDSFFLMGNFAQGSDSDLLYSFCKNGDEAAFAYLVKRHHAMMYRSALRFLGNQEDAHDALQAALIVFARRASELEGRESLGPWLHRVILLESANLRRKRTRQSRRETEAMKQYEPISPAKPVSLLLSELDQAIDSLGAKDRAVVVMHHLEGETFSAIANQLGGSSESWRKRCGRALEKLGCKLGRKGAPVAALTLMAFFTQQQAEAVPVKAHVLQHFTQEALTHSSIQTSTGTISLILMKSKLLFLSSFLGGGLFAFPWVSDSVDEPAMVKNEHPQPRQYTSSTSRGGRVSRTGFDLDALLVEIQSYNEAEQRDSARESSIRLLMFRVPKGDIPLVVEALHGVSSRGRFENIVSALYARWTELDPEEAWANALEESRFMTHARRGVLITWLSVEPDTALAQLLASPHQSNLGVLRDYLRVQVQNDAREAALFVDQVAELWAEADKTLFPQVARAWAVFDPDAAGEWVASHSDVKRRDQLLHQLAQRTARNKALKGLALADRIEDSKKRERARLNTTRWLGIATGPYIFSDYHVERGQGAADGFPRDWTQDELRSFALGSMANYSEKYSELVEKARNEEERQSIYFGAIEGAAYSRPALVAEAVTSLDATLLETDTKVSQKLEIFITRWHELDPVSSQEWLNEQAADAKTELMRNVLKELK